MNNIKSKLVRAGKFLLMGSLLLVTFSITAQERVQQRSPQRQRQVERRLLEGQIVNSQGEPIAGAIINIAEQSNIVLSDENGKFSLSNVALGDEIIVTSIGYKTASSFAEFGTDYVVVMEDELEEYEQTMPVPFGRKPRKFMTESTSAVTGEELQKHPITILQNAFTSTVTGVSVYEWSSEPGWSETEIYIRGLRSQNIYARRPLILVDNVERDLSFLDAYPIENITILKDAAATAIYGMRGANGAILVTTKRGVPGKTKIEFAQEVGFQSRTNRMQNQNSYEMAITRNRVRELSGQARMYTDKQIEMYRRVVAGEKLEGVDQYKYFNTDWFDDLYRENAPIYKTNFQISGGTESTRYYVSASYLRQEGIWNNEYANYHKNYNTQHNLNRFNLRTNVDIDVNKYLNVSLDLGGRMDYIQQPNIWVFGLVTFGAVEANPMEPKKTPEGLDYRSSTAQSPLWHIAGRGLDKNRRRNVYSTATLTGDLNDLVKGLKAYATISFDSYDVFRMAQSSDLDMFNYNYADESVTDVSEFRLRRNRTYSALSNPSAQERGNSYNTNFHAGLLFNRSFGMHYIDARAFVRTYMNMDNTGSQGSQSSKRFLSFNGQGMYVYDSRYIFSGSLSRMGHDNFDPSNRWGTFGGVSLGWILSEESWLNHENLNLLKLRASYGRAGMSETMAETSRYPYQNVFEDTSTENPLRIYTFGTSRSVVNGVREVQAGNKNSIWELSDMVNIGLDFDGWNGKMYGSVDAFKEWRSNILVARSNIPSLFGVSVANDSYGKVESKGYEVTLGHRNQINDFSYFFEGRVTYNTNKIVDLDETTPNVPWQARKGDRIRDYTSVSALYEGAFNRTVGGWNLYKFVEWATDPDLIATSHQDAIDNPHKYPYNIASGGKQLLGTAVFEDLDGDRKIDVNDMIPSGYTIIPDLIPSFTLGFGYKGFDARVVMNAYLNRSVFISPAMAWSGWGNMGTQEVVNVWGYHTDDPFDPRNVNASWPRPVYGGYEPVSSDRGTGTYQNDIWIRSGDYWSLRNIEVGYSFPKKLIAKANMTNLRFYFSAYNIQTWSNLPKDMDPDKPMSYVWWYPKVRTFSLGLNLCF
ncbi:MAG TPA: SusC/RagA family TonB-linked outer membrane protein [Petrimonas sp.]|jgi:TonB-linked SusC/RagA family outer membrane protein|nr:SusC/RagA family TonB-linked outer membrane protein [Petrimonas sp.]